LDGALSKPRKTPRRTQFGSKRIPKKFRYFHLRSVPMYVDEPEEFISYHPPKLTKTEHDTSQNRL
jgi:hypothetical protein